MPFLHDTFNFVKGAIGWSNTPPQTQNHVNGEAAESAMHYNADVGDGMLTKAPNEKCEKWLEHIERSKKRRASSEVEDHIPKRSRLSDGDDTESCSANNVGGNGNSITYKNVTPKKRRLDRDLMPPPSAPLDRRTSSLRNQRLKRESLDSVDTASEAHSQRIRVATTDDDDGLEEARRRAAATQLPANSGTWEPDEQRLFFHLAYRGLEPLLSDTWMIDFPTLPLKLFATSDQTPLIQPHRSNEFRAIKALQDLMDTGKTVRDRALSPNRKLRKEPIIEKAATKYLRWALKDIGATSKDVIPVHAVVAMKQGQTTTDTIRDLTLKMHKLSARHRADCNVLTSIEKQEAVDENGEETRLSNDSLDSEHKLPVIYGLMICSSLLAVFTLSSHTPPPAFVVRAQSKTSNHVSEASAQEDDDENEDSGLRFIARFDFSDATSDVWNAFVIAIVAMMVRETLVDIYEINDTPDAEAGEESFLNSSLIDDEYQGNTSTRQVPGAKGLGRTTMRVEDDPDL